MTPQARATRASAVLRRARRDLKRRIRTGDVAIAAVILAPPDELAELRAFEVLELAPGMGRQKVRALNPKAMRASVNLFRPLDELTPRQRRWLIEHLPAPRCLTTAPR